MVLVMIYLYNYLGIINLITFIIYGIDKKRAIKKEVRISEKTLISLGFIGGCLGALIGMGMFHHKTRKIWFYISNILFLAGWSYVLVKVLFL